MVLSPLLAALALLPLVTSQRIGSTPEVHPKLSTQKCTTEHGCKTHQTTLVLDALSHPIIDPKTGQSCLTSSGTLNSTLCPTAELCGQNCAFEGIDYAAHGVHSDGNSLTLRQYLGSGSSIKTVSPRLYLLDKAGKDYRMLQLLNQEFTFTVDVSNLPCGMNGALYFSQMTKSGGRSTSNPGGATYGSGYCDAQCYVNPFFEGAANVRSLGSCCMEMDIWEANSASTQLAPHPCNVTGPYGCTGAECGPAGVCDKNGCSNNPYALGAHNFYAPNASASVDTSKPFTVVTQFFTTDNTTKGDLNQIRRLYVQNGRVIQNALVQSGGQAVDSLTPAYCSRTDPKFDNVGGLAQMGKALQRGMVLIFSIWNDNGGSMNWLDSGNAGPCNSTEGNPLLIQQQNPGTSVVFSNVRWGDINSTY